MQNSLADWELIHGFRGTWDWQAPLRDTTPATKTQDTKTRLDMSAETAWHLAAEALRARFPLQADAITRVERNTVTDFEPARTADDNLAFSVSDGSGMPPRVRVPFAARPEDILAIAHEFGHALQFSVTRQPFIAPVLRETAAFMSTLAFLDHLKTAAPENHDILVNIDASEGAVFLGSDLSALLKKAGDTNAAYSHRDNYPPAYLAARSVQGRDPAIAWEVFLGRLPVVFVAAGMSLGGAQGQPHVHPRYAAIGEKIYSALVRNDVLCKKSIGEVWQTLSTDHPEAGQAVAADHLSFLSALGMVCDILAESDYHQGQPFGTYFRVEILPPLHHGQMRLHANSLGRVTAMATWAELSETATREVLSSGRSLNGNEWMSGQTLFFNDFAARDAQLMPLMRELRKDFFPNREATSLRRNADTSVRRQNRWVGLDRMEEVRQKAMADA